MMHWSVQQRNAAWVNSRADPMREVYRAWKCDAMTQPDFAARFRNRHVCLICVSFPLPPASLIPLFPPLSSPSL